jgi:hypothetical protein
MRKYSVAALVAFVLPLLSIATADAQTPPPLKWNETWLVITPATTCSEGSPVKDCPITDYRIETAATCTATTWDFLIEIPATQLTYKATGLSAGVHCYRAKSKYGGLYTAANVVTASSSKTNSPPAPSPPAAVTATDLVAYQISSGADGVLSATNIGRLPAGSLCTAEVVDVAGVTYHRVDFGRVDLGTTLQQLPIAAWAACG